MVAKQYPREVVAAHCPDQRRQRTQQKVHIHHHRRKLEGHHNPELLSLSAGTSSTARKGNGVGQYEHFSELGSKKESANPLLSAILQDSTKKINKSSLTVKINDGQDERHMRKQTSLASQNLDHIEASHVTFSQVQVVSPFLSGHSSKGPPTDKQIMNFIEKMVAPYRSTSLHQSTKYGAALLQISGDRDCIVPKFNNVIHPPTTPFSNEENVKRQGLNILTEQHTATRGQILKKDNSTSSKTNAALTFKPKEYPQLMRNVAATCAKTEEASPVVLTAVSGMAIDKLPEKNASTSLLTCHSAHEDYRSTCLNINKNLDNTDKMSGVPWTLKSTINQEKGETGPETTESVKLDSLEGVTNTLVEFQTKSISVVSGHDTLQHKTLIAKDASAKKEKRTEELQHFQVTCEDVKTQSKIYTGNNAPSVYLRQELPDQTSHSVNCVKCPQYEDTTDQGLFQQVTSQPCVKVPQYEDISEDEEHRSLAQGPRNNNDQSTFENEGYGQMGVISGFPKPDFGCQHLQGQKPLEWQTGKHASYSPEESESETDYQIKDDDDEWLVIPVSMVNLNFESEDPNEQEDIGRWNATKPAQGRVHQPDSDPALAVAPSQIEEFDTIDSFVKAIRKQFGFCKTTPPHQLECDAEPYNAREKKESYSEAEDSCETEDSCDYTCASQHSRLTVKRQLLEEMSELAPLDMEHCLSEKESEHKEEEEVVVVRTSNEKAQTRSSMQRQKELLAARNGSRQRVSKRNDIIVLDSDTDDDSDQNDKEKSKRKGSLSSGVVDGQDFLCHRSGSKLGFEQVKHDTNGPNVINLDSDTDPEESVTGQLTEGKEQIQQETNRPKKDFDKMVKKDHICKKKLTVARTVSPGSDDGSFSSFAVKNKLVTKMMRRHPDRERPKSKISSKDSSDKLPQSVVKKAHPDNPAILSGEASSQPGNYLKLSKESKDKLDPRTHTTTKSASGNAGNKLLASVTKPKPSSRQISLSNQEGPSDFTGCSTPASGQLPQVRQRSASDGLVESVKASALSSVPKPKPSTSFPTQQLSSSKLKRSHSYSNTSTLEQDLPTKQARELLRTEWHNSFVPTKLDRKSSLGTEKPLRTTKPGPSHQSRQRAPKHRYTPKKSATPLMKKTKQEAIQRTKDINRTMSSGQCEIVAKHYKWAEGQRTAKASSWKRKRL